MILGDLPLKSGEDLAKNLHIPKIKKKSLEKKKTLVLVVTKVI